MTDSVFNDPEAVERGLNLPGVVSYSFVGDSSPGYHARLVSIVEEVVGAENVQYQSAKPSSGGKYTAYRFKLFHWGFAEVEDLYSRVCGLEGTRFVL